MTSLLSRLVHGGFSRGQARTLEKELGSGSLVHTHPNGNNGSYGNYVENPTPAIEEVTTVLWAPADAWEPEEPIAGLVTWHENGDIDIARAGLYQVALFGGLNSDVVDSEVATGRQVSLEMLISPSGDHWLLSGASLKGIQTQNGLVARSTMYLPADTYRLGFVPRFESAGGYWAEVDFTPLILES